MKKKIEEKENKKKIYKEANIEETETTIEQSDEQIDDILE